MIVEKGCWVNRRNRTAALVLEVPWCDGGDAWGLFRVCDELLGREGAVGDDISFALLEGPGCQMWAATVIVCDILFLDRRLKMGADGSYFH